MSGNPQSAIRNPPISLPSSLLVLPPSFLLVCGLVVYRRRKGVYLVVVLLVITSLLGGPLYTAWQIDRFVRLRTAEAAGLETTNDQRLTTNNAPPGEPPDEAVRTFFQELEQAMKPNRALPGYAVGKRPPGRDPRLAGLFQQSLGPEGARLLMQELPDQPPPGGCYPGDVDSDGDGLCDWYETNLLGTSAVEADTDHDLITDTLEIQGFAFAGRQWYTNPLLADSNGDGLTDYAEWPAPVGEAPSWDPDGDGLPNVWDDDNDGDGVMDRIDLSPWSYSPYVSRETYQGPVSPYSVDVNASGQQTETFSLEFQIQPQDHAHLRYAMRILDWPN
jgi:hypothetical protein